MKQALSKTVHLIGKRLTFLFFLAWEMPQNLLGLLLLILLGGRVIGREFAYERLFIEVKGFGVSLGSFIFWSGYRLATGPVDNRRHEYGHSLQSKILGPFYIPLIGIPSVFRNLYGRLHFRIKKAGWTGYHQGFPEKWANILGERHFPPEKQCPKR
jgi:hypothetical protein